MLLRLIGAIWKKLPSRLRSTLSRSIQPRFTVSAGAIVTNDEGKVLLLNHVLRPSSGWGIPGGFMNHGEQPDAAVKREVMEEVGVELFDVQLQSVRTSRRHIEMIFRARGTAEGSVLSREIIELAWFHLDEMPDEMSLDQHRLIRRTLGSDEH
jgi:8-oxo-dGTP diphosphatase